MPKVVWTTENDRKLLIRLIDRSAKSYDTVELCKLFPGATPKAIEERIAKLKREAKAGDGKAPARPPSCAKASPRGTGTRKRRSANEKSFSFQPHPADRNNRNPMPDFELPNSFGCGGELQDDEDPSQTENKFIEDVFGAPKFSELSISIPSAPSVPSPPPTPSVPSAPAGQMYQWGGEVMGPIEAGIKLGLGLIPELVPVPRHDGEETNSADLPASLPTNEDAPPIEPSFKSVPFNQEGMLLNGAGEDSADEDRPSKRTKYSDSTSPEAEEPATESFSTS